MRFVTRWLITILCFFAAIACYVFGAPIGGVVFLVLGVILEGLFWLRVFGRSK